MESKKVEAGKIEDLESDLKKQTEEVRKVQEEVKSCETKVEEKSGERKTLEEQIAVFDRAINLAEKKIEETGAQIEVVRLEVEKTGLEIEATNQKVTEQKEVLGELIRIMEENDKTTVLEMVLANDNLSEFFNEAVQVEDVEKKSHEILLEIRELKRRLEFQKVDLGKKEVELKDFIKKKKEEKLEADSAKNGKEDFLEEVKEDEEVYKEKLAEAEAQQAEVLAMQNKIDKDLEKARTEQASKEKEEAEKKKAEAKKAEEEKNQKSADSESPGPSIQNSPGNEGAVVEGNEENEENVSNSILAWPVGANSSGNHAISAYFHDPTYPWRHLWEHNGIDFPKSTGSPVYASEDGVVVSLTYSNNGYGNYIVILHPDGMATLYAHLDSIGVSKGQSVSKGAVIGGVGSTGFSTGPHLHFTVFNSQGIEIDPLPLLLK